MKNKFDTLPTNILIITDAYKMWIKLLNGDLFSIPYDKEDTIEDVKIKIEEFNVELEQDFQQLFSEETQEELQNAFTLQNYGITKGHTLFLFIKPVHISCTFYRSIPSHDCEYHKVGLIIRYPKTSGTRRCSYELGATIRYNSEVKPLTIIETFSLGATDPPNQNEFEHEKLSTYAINKLGLESFAEEIANYIDSRWESYLSLNKKSI